MVLACVFLDFFSHEITKIWNIIYEPSTSDPCGAKSNWFGGTEICNKFDHLIDRALVVTTFPQIKSSPFARLSLVQRTVTKQTGSTFKYFVDFIKQSRPIFNFF